jgi:PadR family transcriptional regulator, regulatory protein PadR
VQGKRPPDVRSWRSQLLKGTLELAVLLLLRKRRRYGLELVEILNDEVDLGVGEGSIYPLLNRLRAEGKVATEWIDDGVGHAHKYYQLTETGQAACRAMLAAWREHTSAFARLTEEKA